MTSFLLFLLLFIVTMAMIFYLFKLAKKDIFQPIIIAGTIFIVFYLFDIIYILFDIRDNSNFPLSNSIFTYSKVYEITFVAVVCILMWILGDFLASKMGGSLKKTSLNITIDSDTRFRGVLALSLFIIAIIVVELGVFYQFINSIGGFSYYYDHIADRALIFSGNTFLYASIQLTTVIGSIAAGYFISIILMRKTNFIFKTSVISLIILVFSMSLLTGARANLMKSIIIMMVIINYLGKKINLNLRLVISFIILGVLLIGFAQVTRNVNVDNSITNKESSIDKLYNGVEISQINNVMILEQYNLLGKENGSTIAGGLISFIPSSLYEMIGFNKPAGGNARFTEAIWPDRWNRAQSEVALGLLGEVWMNFNYIITSFIFMILGLVYRLIYNLLVKDGRLELLGNIVYIGFIWSIFQLLRGDFYNTVNNLTIYIIACCLMYILIKLTIIRKVKILSKKAEI